MKPDGASTDASFRWEPVPPDCVDKLSTGAMTGLRLRPGERVEWTFHYRPDGTRYVGGYTIRKTQPG